MPSLSEEHYDSDYDTRPEAGRIKPHFDSDESDNERSSSAPRRPLPFLNDEDDDDDDEAPLTAESNKRDRSSSASATASIPIRQPTAFAPTTTTSSGGPTFYHHPSVVPAATPTHVTVSAEGTSMFCVEGYVNTPELSAGRGGGLSQGLSANGPYKSLFRARSKSESRGSGGGKVGAASTVVDAPALHVLAEAAQSPEAQSPVSVASSSPPPPSRIAPVVPAAPASLPAPASALPTSVHTSKKRRKPSPLIASSASPLDSAPALRPSPVPSTNASASSSSHVVIDPSPPPRQPRAKSGNGGGSSATAKGRKHKEKDPPPLAPPAAQSNGNSEQGEHRYERRSLPRQQSGSPFSATAELRGTESAVQGRPRNVQQQRNRAGGLKNKDVGEPPSPTAAPVDNGNYDHAESYYPSYYEAEPSSASDTVHLGGQTLSPPPGESPRPSSSVVNHYPGSARMTASPALKTNSSSETPCTKSRMITLLIEDRRHGTDELAEVHVPLRTIGEEGSLWADAKDVCAALQSGPSRIDGPAKVFTMRGKYRQIFLRISADGEETTRSSNLKVETNKTLLIVVEGISDPRAVVPAPFLGSNQSSHVGTGVMNNEHLLTPVSNHLDLDGIHTTPSDHKGAGQWSVGARKRKRETSLSHIQLGTPESCNLSNTVDSPAAARSLSTSHDHYGRASKSRRNNPISSFDGGYMSDSPPAAHRSQKDRRREKAHPGSRLDRSGYETDQPLPSVRARQPSGMTTAQGSSDRGRTSSLLQPPPIPMEGPQRIHDKAVSFLQDGFMEDSVHWNEFARDRAQVGSLSNVALLRIYWFAHGRVEAWVGSRLPKHLNHKKVEIRHVLDALGVSEDWYRECNDTLSLVIAYGERGERWESPRAVAASRDRAPKSRVGSSGPNELLVLLREVHEEYCERVSSGGIGRGRASSVESM